MENSFINQFNDNKVSETFLLKCKKAGQLFMSSDRSYVSEDDEYKSNTKESCDGKKD